MDSTRFQDRYGRGANETDIAPKYSCLKIPLSVPHGDSRPFTLKGDSISVLGFVNLILNAPAQDPSVYIAFNKADADRIPLVEGLLLNTEFERFFLFNELQEPGTFIRLAVGTDFQGSPPVGEELLRSGIETVQIVVGILPVLLSTQLIVPVRHLSVQNLDDTILLYCGNDTVTTATGYPIRPLTDRWFDKTRQFGIYGIASQDIDVAIMEIA